MRSVIALAIAVGLLGACSPDEPEPSPEPTVEPTTTPEPEPEPEPIDETPIEPEAPRPRSGTPDERDAEAAAEFFVDLYHYSLTTGDGEQWATRSHSECEFCTATTAQVDEYATRGATYRGGAIDHDPAQFIALDSNIQVFAVQLPYRIDAVEVLAADGEVVDEYLPDSGYLVMEVGYDAATGWLLFTAAHHDESFL